MKALCKPKFCASVRDHHYYNAKWNVINAEREITKKLIFIA